MIGALRFALAAWRDIRPIHVAAALLLGIATWAVTTAPYWEGNFSAREGFLSLWGRGMLVNALIGCFLVLAVLIADRVQARGVKRRIAYAAAIVAGVGAGALVDWPIQHFVFDTFAAPVDPREHGIAMYMWPVWRTMEWFMVGGFAVFLYAQRRETLATTVRLRAAELNRVAKSRDMLEARLKAMQARVEPQFLFNTLAQVRRLYRLDSGLAEQMLEQLIAYLRAAMPRMRDASSTLAQEIELVRSYLAIVKLQMGGQLMYAIDIPPGSGVVRMPPMMLLPMVDHAIARGLERKQIDGALRIAAAASRGRLRVTIAGSGAGFISDDADDGVIASIAERLTALYGDAARLELRARDTQGTAVVMEIPYEHVPG